MSEEIIEKTTESSSLENNERIFLVVVDDSPEMAVALRYASRRAKHTKGRVALLYVMESADFQHWAAVGRLMEEEALEEGQQVLQRHASVAKEISNTTPVLHLKSGNRRDEIMNLIEEDSSILALVLAASANRGGPGPLVSAFSSKFIGKLKVPLIIVPGNLTTEEIDAIT